MRITNNLKITWENDLWQAIGEQDVLKLRRQLNDIWKLSETELKNYMMTTFQREH